MTKYLLLFFAFLISACSTDRQVLSYSTASAEEIATIEAIFGFSFNRDYEHRDELLGINVEWGENDIGGIMYFENINAETLNVLIQEDFIAPDMTHNEAPSASEFLEFLREYPHATVGGYAVSPLRADYSVLITSIHIDGRYMTPSHIEAIQQFCQYADEEFTSPEGYCWWD